MVSYDYYEWQFTDVIREDGHLVVKVTVPIDGEDKSNIDLIFDTGAYITVVSRPTARRIKLPLGTGIPAALHGFTAEQAPIAGELMEIPCITLGKHFVNDVKVVVPLDDIVVSEVLGENVLDCFIYTVDHDKDVVFFKKNPNPKPYINKEKSIDLSCGKVLLADS